MIQKVLKVGTSAAVTIPKKSLEEMGIKIGDNVSVSTDTKQKTVTIRKTVTKQESDLDDKVTKLTLNFIERYEDDLKALADK